MTKKPETVKDKLYQVLYPYYGYDDSKKALLAELINDLSPEAIEKLIALHDAIDRTYEYIESSSPTEIFKPSTVKFEGPGNSDAYEYFISSIDQHQEKISKITSTIDDIRDWLDYSVVDSIHLFDDISNHHEFDLFYSYAQKFIALPLEYVNESFDHDLMDFLCEFDSYFYAADLLGYGYHFDLIDIWYKRNIKKNDLKEELRESFYKNGQLKSKDNYKFGKLHGLSESFNDNGQLDRGKNYKFGEEHGPYEIYYENGQLYRKGNYEFGKQVKGSFEYFDKNGELKDGTYERKYDGQLKYKDNYKFGKLHGLSESFNGMFVFSSKDNYKFGEKHGLSESFYENGQLRWKRNYKNGKLHGLYETFDENGQLGSKRNYKNGKLHGLYEAFYKNGQLGRRENYKFGKLHGLRKFFDKNGKFTHKINEKNEEPHGPMRYFMKMEQ